MNNQLGLFPFLSYNIYLNLTNFFSGTVKIKQYIKFFFYACNSCLALILFVLCHGYYDIFLSYRAVGHYKMSGSRCQNTFNWCAMLPSNGEAGPVVQVHRRSKVWVQEFTLPPPAVESGVLDFLSVIIGVLQEMTSKLLSSSDIYFVTQTDCCSHTLPHIPTVLGSRGVQLNI